jgi:hypothetical protein
MAWGLLWHLVGIYETSAPDGATAAGARGALNRASNTPPAINAAPSK